MKEFILSQATYHAKQLTTPKCFAFAGLPQITQILFISLQLFIVFVAIEEFKLLGEIVLLLYILSDTIIILTI